MLPVTSTSPPVIAVTERSTGCFYLEARIIEGKQLDRIHQYAWSLVFFSLCAHIQTKARSQTNHKTAHKVQPDAAVMLHSYLLRAGCLFLWTPLRLGGGVSVEIFLFEWQLRAEGETEGGRAVWDSNQWIHRRLKSAEPRERTDV